MCIMYANTLHQQCVVHVFIPKLCYAFLYGHWKASLIRDLVADYCHVYMNGWKKTYSEFLLPVSREKGKASNRITMPKTQ